MKKFLALILTTALCLSLVACGDEDSSGSSSSSGNGFGDNKTPTIAVGETATTKKCEFTVDYINITNDVKPPNPSNFYSHYEADDGKVYVDFCIAYKNTETSDVDADQTISGKLIYGGKYEYTGFSMIEEDNRSDFTYSNITSIAPLCTEYVHYLFEVPEEVAASSAKIVLKMTIGGQNYQITVREGNGTTSGNTTQQGDKTSGAVTLGEVVATKKGEFSIDYVNIAKKITPPQPSSFYSYYEADDGKVYVDFCFAYKNTRNSSVDADDVISATLKYSSIYQYNGFSIIEEDSRSDFTYSNITSIAPLNTEYMHYLFEVPEEVSTNDKSIKIVFTIDGNNYTYEVR